MLDFYEECNIKIETLVESYAIPSTQFVKIFEVNEKGFDFYQYARDNLSSLSKDLKNHGAILIRGQDADIDRFASLCDLFGDVTSHSELSSPRTTITNGVYTSTDHPSDQKIQMHNEQSYLSYWPMVASFLCVIPSTQGGETPIADCRNFESELPSIMVEKIKNLGVRYIRNIGIESTIRWQEVYGVETKSELQDYCDARGINLSWLDEDTPRTESPLPAFRYHPDTDDLCFFNNIVVASPYSLDEADYNNLVAIYKDPNKFPINVCYGDGSEFTREDIHRIMSAYLSRTFEFKWKKGDILIADNMLTAHSRNPFSGNRKILVRVNRLFDSLK
jgi:alpha-ketoglutarate-dependent taurine dioxygenase